MENQNPQESFLSDAPQPVYSRVAIRLFAVLITPLFGGVMLMQNLRQHGKAKEGNRILLYSLLFTVLTVLVVTIPDHPPTALTYICNVAGASVLSEYFYKKYFPDESLYPKKKIWIPLLIAILIVILFVGLFIISSQ